MRGNGREPAHVGESFSLIVFIHLSFLFLSFFPFVFLCLFLLRVGREKGGKGEGQVREKRECSQAARSQLHFTVQYAWYATLVLLFVCSGMQETAILCCYSLCPPSILWKVSISKSLSRRHIRSPDACRERSRDRWSSSERWNCWQTVKKKKKKKEDSQRLPLWALSHLLH